MNLKSMFTTIVLLVHGLVDNNLAVDLILDSLPQHKGEEQRHMKHMVGSQEWFVG
jgi:hypothetical protein